MQKCRDISREICDQVKDHQDDCNDNSNVGDDRVLETSVIVMTATMTMVTAIGVDDDNNNGDDRSKNIPLHHQVPRTECRSVPRNVCNPVILENSLNSEIHISFASNQKYQK